MIGLIFSILKELVSMIKDHYFPYPVHVLYHFAVLYTNKTFLSLWKRNARTLQKSNEDSDVDHPIWTVPELGAGMFTETQNVPKITHNQARCKITSFTLQNANHSSQLKGFATRIGK